MKYFSKQILSKKGGMIPVRTFILSVLSIMTAFILFSRDIQAGTLYECIDKDGSVILTDSPPPGCKVKVAEQYRDMTEAEKQELKKAQASTMEKFQDSQAKRKEKEESLRAARAEYEQALKDEQRYRSNKNQASGYAQQRHWIKMMEEQSKVIAEKKKKLQELESEP
jgi:hypothetical protein